jgi:hypothetical protein
VRSNNRREQRKPVRLGAMQVEREVSVTPRFVELLRKFGFIDRDTKLPKHAGWSEYLKVENDPMVRRIRERLKSEGKLQQRAGLFSQVDETWQALSVMNEEQLLRCRARRVLNDFRLSAEEKEQNK